MEAIILAGGFGTRLKDVLGEIPKPMALIGKKPFLSIILDKLHEDNFTSVVMSLGYKSEIIKNYFGSQYKGISIKYAIEDKPLGTGGGIKKALNLCTNDFVFVINGDTYIDFDTKKIKSLWMEYKKPIIVATNISDASRYGSLVIKDKKLIGFAEKKNNGPALINAGCYIFKKNQLDEYSANTYFSLEDSFLKKHVKNDFFRIHIHNGTFIDIGTPEDFKNSQSKLKHLTCE